MSFTEILDEVEHLSDTERTELLLRLQSHQLATHSVRTAEMSHHLDQLLAGKNVVTEEELQRRLHERQRS